LSASPDTGQQAWRIRALYIAEISRGSGTGTFSLSRFMPTFVFQCQGPRSQKLRARHFSVAMMAALPAFAVAQAVLPPVVVTAARVEQRIDDTFAAVTVLQRADIEASQAPDLVTLLRRQPGVEIAQLGGYGTQSSAFIRGGESRHTLVIVDGVPLGNLNFGLAPLEHLMLANVERIEIARGNLSSLYGSSALGGVIQIFTTGRVEGLKASGSATVASHDTYGLKAALANRVGDLSFGIDAAQLRSKGYNATDPSKIPGTNPDRDGYRNTTVGGLLVYGQGPWSGELRVRRVQGGAEYDSQFGPATQADESKFQVDTASVAVGHKTETLANELRVSSYADDLRADVTAFPYFVTTRSRQMGWSGIWTVTPGQRLSGAIEQSKAHINSDTTYGTTLRTQDTLRLGYNGELGAHQWQLNLRRDDYSDFGEATTGLVGYGYQISSSWRASGTVATGFNAPTFNDLFNPFGGNALLKPERSRNHEIALNYDDAAVSARATVFDNSYRDLIANDSSFNRVNVGRARVRGLEIAGTVRAGGVRIVPSVTFQDPKDLTADTDLPRRAHKLFSLGLDTEVQGYRIGADLRGSGNRFDRVGNARPLDRYVTLDLMLQKQIVSGLTAQVALRNVTDEEFETAYGYRQPGRTGTVTLSYALK
jgi:vitamin B12 transporter